MRHRKLHHGVLGKSSIKQHITGVKNEQCMGHWAKTKTETTTRVLNEIVRVAYEITRGDGMITAVVSTTQPIAKHAEKKNIRNVTTLGSDGVRTGTRKKK